MGYAVYEDFDPVVYRWAGYGVPAPCDWPECDEKIDRGLAYKCEEHYSWDEEGEEEIEDEGCGYFFCEAHRYETETHDGIRPKPDSLEWEAHMLTDESWAQWREENPGRVTDMKARQA